MIGMLHESSSCLLPSPLMPQQFSKGRNGSAPLQVQERPVALVYKYINVWDKTRRKETRLKNQFLHLRNCCKCQPRMKSCINTSKGTQTAPVHVFVCWKCSGTCALPLQGRTNNAFVVDFGKKQQGLLF